MPPSWSTTTWPSWSSSAVPWRGCTWAGSSRRATSGRSAGTRRWWPSTWGEPTRRPPVLRLEALGVSYGPTQVLWGVDLHVPEGAAVALLGRNGMGKTTLLRTVVGVHPVASGRILYAGADCTRTPAYLRARRGIGYVPQGRGIFPYLTVEENLEVALAAAGPGRGIPPLVFDLFPSLFELRARKGGALSGGQQQLLAIARALVARPRLLLLAEPTEGIQPSIVERIEEALGQVRRDLGIAVLLVEQYLEFAWRFADLFYVLQKGRIVAQGATSSADRAGVETLLHV